ncbi:MAG: glycosyltransferase family 39 protein [Planctomycetaceae bacterium]|nr:glycosyltransferase family 39 protein [Planctomycetaceae bacterium]
MNRYIPFTQHCRLFWTVMLLFAAVWTALPALLHTGYRNDVCEEQILAADWDWGFKKHPCSPMWILEIVNIATHRSFAAPFIASQLCAIIAVWSVWQTARTVLPEKLSLAAAFSVLPYKLFTTESVLYNHNTTLIAFWCLSVYCVVKSFQTNKYRYWTAAGAALALAFHSKYAALFLVLSILFYMIVRSEGRKYWKTPGPYLTMSVAFALFLPHIVWLFHNNFSPLYYAGRRPPFTSGWQYITEPLRFAGSQCLFLIPVVIVLFPLFGFKWKVNNRLSPPQQECEKLLFYCFAVPLVLHICYIIVKGVDLRSVFGACFWLFTGLWLLLRFQIPQVIPDASRSSRREKNHFRNVFLMLLFVQCCIIGGWLTVFFSGKQPSYCYYPSKQLSEECERVWKEKEYGRCPCIGGEHFLAGHAAFLMKERPFVEIVTRMYGHNAVNEHGGLVLWDAESAPANTIPPDIQHRYPKIKYVKSVELPYQKYYEHSPLHAGIGIVPPPRQRSTGKK